MESPSLESLGALNLVSVQLRNDYARQCILILIFLSFTLLLIQEKTKERCRKGIPPAVRGKVWQYLTGAIYLKEKNPDLYQVQIQFSLKHWFQTQLDIIEDRSNFSTSTILYCRWPTKSFILFYSLPFYIIIDKIHLLQKLASKESPEWESIIRKDVPRTFPYHTHFLEHGGPG